MTPTHLARISGPERFWTVEVHSVRPHPIPNFYFVTAERSSFPQRDITVHRHDLTPIHPSTPNANAAIH